MKRSYTEKPNEFHMQKSNFPTFPLCFWNVSHAIDKIPHMLTWFHMCIWYGTTCALHAIIFESRASHEIPWKLHVIYSNRGITAWLWETDSEKLGQRKTRCFKTATGHKHVHQWQEKHTVRANPFQQWHDATLHLAPRAPGGGASVAALIRCHPIIPDDSS